MLVTGCDSGFGYLTAQRLDQLGARVIAGCLTKAPFSRCLRMLYLSRSFSFVFRYSWWYKALSENPALFNLALAVRRDFGLPTSIPTGAGETDGCRSVRGKKRTRAGKLDVDRCQQRLERFFTASAAVGFREANQ